MGKGFRLSINNHSTSILGSKIQRPCPFHGDGRECARFEADNDPAGRRHQEGRTEGAIVSVEGGREGKQIAQSHKGLVSE
jgi:hypothetical protein